MIKGTSASAGIAWGKAIILKNPELKMNKMATGDPAHEFVRLAESINQAETDLQNIRQQVSLASGETEAGIFDAHLLMLRDPMLIQEISAGIEQRGESAEAAVQAAREHIARIFENMDDSYMQERAADILDVTQRIIHCLTGYKAPILGSVDEDSIIVATDLPPSATAQINSKIKGFVTEAGGRTSHFAILARSLELPAVIGASNCTEIIRQGDFLLVDGNTGEIWINPERSLLDLYRERQRQSLEEAAQLADIKFLNTITADGFSCELAANIGNPNDVTKALDNGAEGIGLFRTEFLFIDQNAIPTEDEQFAAYRQVLEAMQGKPVIIRTLDIGADKELPILNLARETNPALGYRAIRLCLDKTDLFKTQLRALLRAGAYGNLKIMFPMISTLEELRQAKELLQEATEELSAAGVSISSDCEVGIMIEVPAAAIIADQLARECDFFSIGTNDLIQYTFAADRLSEPVSYLYQPYHPSILRLLKWVIDAAHRERKWVGMCGEMAGDSVAIPLLLGLGLDEFSMSANLIPKTRKQIKSLSRQEAEQIVKQALQMGTSEDVLNLLAQNQ